MRRPAKFVLATLSLLIFAACASSGKPSVDATVSCGNFGRADTDLGILNIAPRADLGDLMWVDANNKRVVRVMTAAPVKVTDEARGDTTKIVKELQLSANVSAEIPATVKAKLDEALKARTELVITKLREKKANDPLGELNENADVLERLSSQPDTLWLYGQSVGVADRTWLQLTRDTSTGADVNVFKYGEYTINVRYGCNQQIEELAADGRPMFWRFLPIRYDSTKKKIVLDSTAFNPNEYSWVSAR